MNRAGFTGGWLVLAKSRRLFDLYHAAITDVADRWLDTGHCEPLGLTGGERLIGLLLMTFTDRVRLGFTAHPHIVSLSSSVAAFLCPAFDPAALDNG